MPPGLSTSLIQRWKRSFRRRGSLFGKPKWSIGVDLGSTLLKAVLLKRGSHGVTLENFLIQSSKDWSFHDPAQGEDPLYRVSQRFLDQFPRKRCQLGLAVSGPSVAYKMLNLSAMNEEEIRDHLQWELDRYISCDVQEVAWDVYLRPVSPDRSTISTQQLLVVARKEFVNDQVEMFQQEEIGVDFVEGNACSLMNAVAWNYGTTGTWLIVDMGASGMLMVVSEGGEPLHVSHVGYEMEWYQDLMESLYQAQEDTNEGNEPGKAEQLLLEQLIQEIFSQITEVTKFLNETHENLPKLGILLSGGYASIHEIPKQLSQKLKVPVQIMDPCKAIHVAPNIKQDPEFPQISPLLSVAVGTALRGAVFP